jgi:ADP-heptose:LPS heptosyltransferase
MGDLVQSLYLLEDLKRGEGHEVSLLVDRRLEGFARARVPWLDAVHCLDLERTLRGFRSGLPWQGLWEPLARELAAVRAASFDRFINLNFGTLAACVADAVRGETPVEGFHSGTDGSVGGPWVDLVSRLVRTNRRWNRFHLVDVFRFHAARRAPPAADPDTKTGRPLDDRSVLAVQVATRGRKRTWKPERFAEVIRGVHEEAGCEVLLLGEARERPLADSIARRAGCRRVRNLAGKTSLEDLTQVLSGCDRLLSGDTGTLHLACRLGVPSVAVFFGPAYAFETGPYGRGHIVVQPEPACAPCGEDAPCEKGTACGEQAAPRTVVRLLMGGPVPPAPGVSVYASDFVGEWMQYRPLHRRRAGPDDVAGLLYWGGAGEFLAAGEGRLPSPALARAFLVDNYWLDPGWVTSAGFSVEAALPRGIEGAARDRLREILNRQWRRLKEAMHEYPGEKPRGLAAPAA